MQRIFFGISAIALLFAMPANAQVIKAKEAFAGKVIHADLTKNDARLKLDNSPFDLFRIKVLDSQIISAHLKAEGFMPTLEIGEEIGYENCDACDYNGADAEGNAIVKAVAQKDGYIYVRVNSATEDSFGKYSLTLNVTDPPAEKTGKIEIGKTINGKLEESDMVDNDAEAIDRYKFKLAANEKVQISLSSEDFDPDLMVKGPKFEGEDFYEYDGDSGLGDASLLVITAPVAGAYIIEVVSADGDYGDYELKLGKYVAPKSAPNYPINTGEIKQEKLLKTDIDLEEGDPINSKNYIFKVNSNESYWIEAQSNDFDPSLGLYTNEKGTKSLAIVGDEDSGEGNNALILYNSLDSEEIIIKVSAPKNDEQFEKDAGEFKLSVRKAIIAKDYENPKPIILGKEIIGEFKDGDPRGYDKFIYDFYALDLKKNQRIQIDLDKIDEKSYIDPMISIGTGSLDDFEYLTISDDKSIDNKNASIRFRAPNDGIYLVKIASAKIFSEGKYRLKAAILPKNIENPIIKPISLGTEIKDSLGEKEATYGLNDLPYKLYSFEVKAGKKYSFSQKSEAFETQISYKFATDSDDNYEYIDDNLDGNGAFGVYEAQKNGKILVRASSYYGYSQGDFTLKITEE